jgi:hypothetical protein
LPTICQPKYFDFLGWERNIVAHYTVLGLVDTNKAINSLPAVAKVENTIVASDTARKQQNPASTGAKVQQHDQTVRVKESNASGIQVVENAIVSSDLRHNALSRNKKRVGGRLTNCHHFQSDFFRFSHIGINLLLHAILCSWPIAVNLDSH